MLVPFFPCQIVVSLQQMSLFTASPSNSSFSKKSTTDTAQNKLYFQLLFLKLLKILCKFLHSVYMNLNVEPTQLLNNAIQLLFTNLKANNFFLLQCSITFIIQARCRSCVLQFCFLPSFVRSSKVIIVQPCHWIADLKLFECRLFCTILEC